jgi:hypothetical protein
MSSFPLLLPKYDGPETTATYASAYEGSVIRWTNAAFDEAEYDQQQVEELQLVQSYIDYIEGKQWTTARPASKARPVNNLMVGLFWELIGQLTDIRPVIEIRTTQAEPTLDLQRACSVLNGGLRGWSLDTDFDLKLAKCIAYAILTTSFAKFQWNPFLNFGAGDIEMVPLGPDSVLPLKSAGDLESCEAIIFKDVWSLRKFRQVYPSRGALVQPDDRYSNYQIAPQAPPSVPPMIFKLMSDGMKRQLTGGMRSAQSAVPMAQLREFWIRDETRNESTNKVQIGEPGKNWSYLVPPGGKLYPRGRLIVMGGNVILWDGPNPYWHGRPPFAMLRLNIVPWSMYGLSDCRAQVPLQDIMNNVLAGVLDCVKRAVNPAFFAPKNAFSPEVWQTLDFSLPNARAAYSQQSAHEPKFVPPPVLPGFVMALYQQMERSLEKTSTGAIASEVARKKQVPASDGIEQLKAEKQTPVRLKGRNIESFLRVGGQMMVSNMIQFWSTKRRLQVLGTKGLTFEDFDWDPGTMVPAGTSGEQFVQKFKFYIQPGSLLSIKRVEEKMEVLMLRKMQAIDLKTMYKKLGGDYNVDEIEKNLLEERKALAATGGPPKPGKKPH